VLDRQVERDGVAERHTGPQLLRLGEADFRLGMEHLGAGDAAQDGGRLVQPAAGELRDVELEPTDRPCRRELMSVEDNRLAIF